MDTKQDKRHPLVAPAVLAGGNFGSYFDHNLVWLLALLSCLPFAANFSAFKQMFWFGDDFAFMADFEQIGFIPWVYAAFSENFLPVFKTVWAGILLGSGGNYLIVLMAIWAVHAINTGLLAHWMMKAGFGRFGTTLTAVAFGVSATHIETLTWCIQLSEMMAVTFFLVAAIRDFTWAGSPRALGWPFRVSQGFLCLASAWSHARGVLTGFVLANMTLFAWPTGKTTPSRSQRLALAAAYLTPTVITGILIFLMAPSNHHEVLSDFTRLRWLFSFAFWYLAFSPLVPFFNIVPSNWGIQDLTGSQMFLFGTLKFGAVALALVFTDTQQRRLLVTLLLLELGNALLLGLGRSEGGNLPMALSSRYQYNSLLCSMPFFSAALSALARYIPTRRYLRTFICGIVLSCVAWSGFSPWKILLPSWVGWRSLSGRQILLEGQLSPEGRDLVGAGFITNARGRELAKKYHLH